MATLLAPLLVTALALLVSPPVVHRSALAPHHRRASAVVARGAAPLPPRALPTGAVVELWHNGRLHLGNSRGMASPTTLRVELSTGEEVKVDGGQLVDVWSHGGEPHVTVPGTTAEWSAAHADAAKLLNELPPHALDLQPMWQTLTMQRGGCGCVDSDRVSAALFAEEPEAPRRQRQGGSADVGHADGGWVARRMAAAQLLGEERVLFKRQQGQLVRDGEGDNGGDEVAMGGGGFKPLPRAQAESRAEGLLLEGMRAMLKRREGEGEGGGDEGGAAVEWAPPVLPLLAELEMAALGVKNASKPLCRTLEALGEPPSAQGARQLLVRTGQWQQEEDDVAGASVRDRLNSVDPFARAVLEAAALAVERIGERRRAYAALPLPDPPEPQEKPQFAEHARLPSLASMRGGGGRGRGGRGGGRDRGGGRGAQSAAAAAAAAAAEDEDEARLDGRVDLRVRCPRAFACDAGTTDFRDDAFSLDLATGMLYVHVADLTGIVTAHDALDETARLRLQSIYASAMPLHMLPPSLLGHACLSDTHPNECLTAMMQLDAFGHVRHCRIVRSLVPPVRVVSFEEFDALLRDDAISSQPYSELRAVAAVTRRRAEGRDKSPRRAITGVRWRGGVEAGWRPELVVKTPARVAVDECLAMFSYAARGVAKRHNMLRLPQTEHQRIATAPLRRYADLIAQRQLAAALRGEAGMPPGEVAALERRLQTHHRELQHALNDAQQPLMLRALESMCARQAAASGVGYAVLEATVSRRSGAASKQQPAAGARRGGGAGGGGGGGGGGRGGGGGGGGGSEGSVQVRLSAGGVLAHVLPRNEAQRSRVRQLAEGQKLRVRLRQVDPRGGRVQVELHE